MFAPGIKYGIRIGLIAVITGLILAVFANVQIPTIDFTPITNAVSQLLAVLYYYVPVMQIIVPVIFTLTGIRLALLAWKIGSIAIKWVWKVNE